MSSEPHRTPTEHRGQSYPAPWEVPSPEVDRHGLRVAATKRLWDKRAMLPEHSDEIVDDVLDVVLPMLFPDGRYG